MYKQGIGDFKYFVGISSLAQIATRDDRVCVLNILGGESSDVTPVSHVFSGGNVVFGTAPGKGGQVLDTPIGDIPVYNNVREGLDAGHRFNCGVVYLPPSAARDGVAELIRVNPDCARSSSSPRRSPCTMRAKSARWASKRHRHLRRQRARRRRLVEPGAHRRRAGRRHRRKQPDHVAARCRRRRRPGTPRVCFSIILNSPFGVALVGNDLYVANTDAIVRYPYKPGDTKITAPGTTLTQLPGGPIDHHWTKSLVASPDGQAALCRRRLQQQHYRKWHRGRKGSRRDLGGRPRHRPLPDFRQRIAQSQRAELGTADAARYGPSSTSATRSAPIWFRII